LVELLDAIGCSTSLKIEVKALFVSRIESLDNRPFSPREFLVNGDAFFVISEAQLIAHLGLIHAPLVISEESFLVLSESHDFRVPSTVESKESVTVPRPGFTTEVAAEASKFSQCLYFLPVFICKPLIISPGLISVGFFIGGVVAPGLVVRNTLLEVSAYGGKFRTSDEPFFKSGLFG